MNRKRISLLIFFFALFLAANLAQAAGPYELVIEHGVEAKMRDGVVLRADVYRPKSDGQFPVLLERTPYDKNNNWGSIALANKAVPTGYVVIVQDVRGRYTSEGDCTRSCTSPMMGMTQWSGRQRSRIPTAKSGCLAGPM